MKLLNIACGSRHSEGWINIDFASDSEDVIKHNILNGLPFEKDSFDVIYASHFLEHLTPKQAYLFLGECYKKLKTGGIIRIVVPDLLNICREYVRVCDNEPHSFKREWLVIEMIDQIARMSPGGGMGKIYKDKEMLDKDYKAYIKERVGEDLDKQDGIMMPKKNTLAKVKNKLLYLWLAFVSHLIPYNIRNYVYNQTPIGENHRWMYDKYSLSKLLSKNGFKKTSLMSFKESNIPNFRTYLLDENSDGSPYKGVSSLYIEAIK